MWRPRPTGQSLRPEDEWGRQGRRIDLCRFGHSAAKGGGVARLRPTSLQERRHGGDRSPTDASQALIKPTGETTHPAGPADAPRQA